MSKTRTKTVRIDKTRHATQPYKITEVGTVDKERKERYVTERTACIGAVRACRDFLLRNDLGAVVRILLPNNRERRGWISVGKVYLSDIITTKAKKVAYFQGR